MKSILDRSFHYTTSVETDVRKTFARIRREMRKREEAQAIADAEVRGKILVITPRKQEASL